MDNINRIFSVLDEEEDSIEISQDNIEVQPEEVPVHVPDFEPEEEQFAPQSEEIPFFSENDVIGGDNDFAAEPEEVFAEQIDNIIPPVKDDYAVDNILPTLSDAFARNDMDPAAVNAFFELYGINIDISQNSGLDRLIRFGLIDKPGQLGATKVLDYYFGDKDMTPHNSGEGKKITDTEKVSFFDRFIRDIKDPDAYVFVYRDGEEFPCRLTCDERTGRLSVSEPVDELITRPEPPLWIVRLLNRAFGMFAGTLADYDKKMELFDLYSTFRSIQGIPAGPEEKARQLRLRQEKEANDRLVDELSQIAYNINGDITKMLDDVFGRDERSFGGISRLDCVKIGGKSLRGLLTESAMKKHGIPSFDSEHFAKVADEVNMPDPDKVALILTAAALKGCKIEFFKPDPKTGRFITNPETGKLSFPIRLPRMNELARGAREQSLFADHLTSELGIDFDVLKNGNPHRDTACAAGIRHLNWFHTLERFDIGGESMDKQFFSRLAKENGMSVADLKKTAPVGGMSRFDMNGACLNAHTAAYLLVSGKLTFSQLFDASEEPKMKAEAGKFVFRQFTTGAGNSARMCEMNMRASRALAKLIDQSTADLDLSNSKTLFTPKMQAVMAARKLLSELNNSRNNFSERDILAAAAVLDRPAIDLNAAGGREKAQAVIDGLDSAMPDLSYLEAVYDSHRLLAMMQTGCSPFDGAKSVEAEKCDILYGSVVQNYAAEKQRGGASAGSLISAADKEDLREYKEMLDDALCGTVPEERMDDCAVFMRLDTQDRCQQVGRMLAHDRLSREFVIGGFGTGMGYFMSKQKVRMMPAHHELRREVESKFSIDEIKPHKVKPELKAPTVM